MTDTPPPSRTRERAEVLSPWPARAMQALLDRDPDGIGEGDPLPLGWHWLYFRRPVRASHLGSDGHERRGAFMPETGLPRRMWAGGELRALSPVRIGEPAELSSEIREVKDKRGKSGRLVFVTVGHVVRQGGRACVEEEQVIVYREAAAVEGVAQARAAHAAVARDAAAPAPEWSETFLPTPVTLFQFSALTHNGHRIHYDHRYVTEHEGYPGLLVHGPLTALLLLDTAQRHGAAALSSFRYRALAPLFVDEPITLVGRPETSRAADADPASSASSSGGRVVEALGPSGTIAMRGWVG